MENNNTQIDFATAEKLLAVVEAQAAVMMLIVLGMILVLIATTCFACKLRKAGFVFLCLYGIIMSLMGAGTSNVIGPIVTFAAIVGFVVDWVTSTKAKSMALTKEVTLH